MKQPPKIPQFVNFSYPKLKIYWFDELPKT